MKMRIFFMVAASLAFVAGATLLQGAAQDQANASKALEQQLTDALKTRAASAQRAFEATAAAFEAETVTLDTFADAIEKLAAAELALATKPDERIAALQRNVERTKQVEAKIKLLYDIGTRGGEAKDYFSAKRDRESAEIMLLNARIQAKP
jgi:hypothetical protein